VAPLQPGWQTLTWEEAVSHQGSPFRIALLDENEREIAVLMDHIPHWLVPRIARVIARGRCLGLVG
jgi:hypothetical protein